MNNVYAAIDSLPWVTVVGGGFGVVPIEGKKRKKTNYLMLLCGHLLMCMLHGSSYVRIQNINQL